MKGLKASFKGFVEALQEPQSEASIPQNNSLHIGDEYIRAVDEIESVEPVPLLKIEYEYSAWIIQKRDSIFKSEQQMRFMKITNGKHPTLKLFDSEACSRTLQCVTLSVCTYLEYENANSIEIRDLYGNKFSIRFADSKTTDYWMTIISRAIRHGHWIDKLRIIRRLHCGKFSKVILCEHPESKERLILKTVPGAVKGNNEADVISQLDQAQCSQHVARPVVIFENKDTTCFIFRWYSGGTLFKSLLRSKQFSETKAATLTRQLLETVNEVHEAGLIHCDIKLENVCLTDDKKLRLIDFGAAVPLEGPLDESKRGRVVGTPGYVSPERLEGKPASRASDVFSCGVMLYQMLVGKHPFKVDKKDKTRHSKLAAYINCDLELTSARWAPVSEEAKEIVRGMLDPLPETRWSIEKLLEHPWMQMT